jgi:hypothetical protein
VKEEWKTIRGVEVSSLGRYKEADGSIVDSSDPRVQPAEKYVFAWNGDRLHRLICEAFHGPPKGDRVLARRLNGLPRDNRASNLRWGDRMEHFRDRVAGDRAESIGVSILQDRFDLVDQSMEARIGTSSDPAQGYPGELGGHDRINLGELGLYDWLKNDPSSDWD